MRFEKSLTSSVHDYISTELALKVIKANSTQAVGRTALEIRRYLTDSETICTPDFMIRRYLQAFHPGLLADLGPLPDLVHSQKNLPWPREALAALSTKLEALSKEQGAAISAAEWSRYFNKSVPTNREKIFRMAFSLKMDVSHTLDLLLACGMEPYSVRYPLDMICLFCQKVGGTYTWAQAKQMLDQFLAKRTPDTFTAAPTANGTQQLEADLNALFERSLQGSNAQQALIDYMVNHSGEFVSFRDKDQELFLPGYSLRRSAQFSRLAQYLAVLYPSIITPAKRKNTNGDPLKMDLNQWDNREEFVIDPETGKFSLPTLVRAMFWASSWNDLEWNESAPKGSFESNMRIFCKNYKQHIDKVNRLFTGGKNIAFFDRRDALLFIFFLISGYTKLLDYDDYDSAVRITKLETMSTSGKRFDSAVGQVLARVRTLYESPQNASEHFNGLCACFDMILGQMEHSKLYLPAQFDRFVLLALLSQDPEELASLVMSEAELQNSTLPFEKRSLPLRSF